LSSPQTTSSSTADLEDKLLRLVIDLNLFSEEKYFSSGLNVFEATGIFRQEIRHSNFLAFLLRPSEGHGLGDSFLKRLIQKALDNLSVEVPISTLATFLADFSDAKVQREKMNMDILIESPQNNLLFVIENKIDSSEGENQLKKYEERIRHEYPKQLKLFCYLTMERELASSDQWASISYSDVVDALKEAASRRSSSLSQEAQLVIDHYIDVVRRKIVPDQALIDKCRRIYELHREAIDLVIQYGEVSAFTSAAEQFFEAHTELSPYLIRATGAAFLPTPLASIIPTFEDVTWFGQQVGHRKG
jgi:hypothetical protein